MKTTQDDYKGELIGKKVKVKKAKNINNENIQGTIIDETKNTLKIKSEQKTLQIIKQNANFEINKKGQKIILRGDLLVGNPEDRIKKKIPKKIKKK